MKARDPLRVWLAPRREAFPPAVALSAAGIALQVLLAAVIGNVWYRLAFVTGVLALGALRWAPVGWREIYRPRAAHVAVGVASAALLYGAGALVARLAASVPALSADLVALYAWKTAVPAGLAAPLLLLIIAAEEIAWRNAVTLPFAARLGPWTGTVAAAAVFALAHLPLGIPLLVAAAFGAGLAWSGLVVFTRSAVPALVSHVLWDLAVLFWLPYVRS